jgi:hypothetical protein
MKIQENVAEGREDRASLSHEKMSAFVASDNRSKWKRLGRQCREGGKAL